MKSAVISRLPVIVICATAMSHGFAPAEKRRSKRLCTKRDRAQAQALCDRAREVDVEALRVQDIRAAHDADLEAVARERHADRQLSRRDRRGGPRLPPDGEGQRNCDSREEGPHRELAITLTGIPTYEKSNIHFAVAASWRTQPWEAA